MPEREWFCVPCGLGKDPLTLSCVLCSNRGGAFNRTDKKDTWVHRVCAFWTPDAGCLDLDTTPPVMKTDFVSKARWTESCVLCKKRGVGAVTQCTYKRCAASVHPFCLFSLPNEFHRDNDSNTVLCRKHAPTSSSGAKRNVTNQPSSGGDDIESVITKLKLYISDKQVVRMLFFDGLHVFAAGSEYEQTSVAEQTEWAVEKLVQRNEAELLRVLHDFEIINLRSKVKGKPTLLYLAVDSDSFDCCRLLLDLGVDIDAFSKDTGPRDSALHNAARFGYARILDLLLARGARVNILNHHDETPLILACRAGSVDCVRLLLAHGADAEQRTKAGEYALKVAAYGTSCEVIAAIMAVATFPSYDEDTTDADRSQSRSGASKSAKSAAASSSSSKPYSTKRYKITGSR